MFKVNDLLVYESSGVCRVTAITEKSFSYDPPRTYYELTPLFSKDGTIYTPVDNKKVTMRPVITKEQALEIIRNIPESEIRSYEGLRTTELEAKYREASASHRCEDLIPLVMSIYEKTRAAVRSGRKISEVDTRYMKKTEDLINGELSVALGIGIEEVPAIIEKELEKAKKAK